MGALLDAITGQLYKPTDNSYGIGAAGVVDALPMLSNPYASTGRNALYTLGGTLLGGILANYAKRESDQQNANLFKQALSLRSMTPEAMQSAVDSEPRLTNYATALLEQQQLQELANQQAEAESKRRVQEASAIEQNKVKLNNPFIYKYGLESGLYGDATDKANALPNIIDSQVSGEATGQELAKSLQALGGNRSANNIMGGQEKTLNDFMSEAMGDPKTASMLYERYLKDKDTTNAYLQGKRTDLQTLTNTLDSTRKALEGSGETGGGFGSDTLRQLGLYAEQLTGDKNAAETLGARKDLESLSLTDFAAKIRQNFPGQVSDREMQMYIKASPSTSNTPEENAAIYNRMKRIELIGNKNLEYIQSATNSGLTLEQAQRSLSEYEKRNPTFIKIDGKTELNPNRLNVNLGDINFANPQRLETTATITQEGEVKAEAAPLNQQANNEMLAPQDNRGIGTKLFQAIAGDNVQPPSSVGEALSNLGSNLTSSDWWFTRPSGEQISGKQAFVGPLTSALDALTLGGGDEAVSGVNAAIDTVTQGKSLGKAYDQRLKEYRDINKNFKTASPTADIALGLIAGSKLPIGEIEGVKDAIKTGAKIGGTYGFLSGEGSTGDRVRKGAIGGVVGGAAGGTLDVTIKGAAKVYRNLLGINKSAANSTAKSFSKYDVREANQSIDRGIALVKKEAGINNWASEEGLVNEIYQKSGELAGQRTEKLSGILTDVQEATGKTIQINAKDVYNQLPEIKPEDKIGIIKAINDKVKAINKQYKSKLTLNDLQTQKELYSQGYKYGLEDNINPLADKAIADYTRRKIEIEVAKAARKNIGGVTRNDFRIVRNLNKETKDLINIRKIYEAKVPGAGTNDPLSAAKRAGWTTGSSGQGGWGNIFRKAGNLTAMAIDMGTAPVRGVTGAITENQGAIRDAFKAAQASGFGQVKQGNQKRDVSDLLIDEKYQSKGNRNDRKFLQDYSRPQQALPQYTQEQQGVSKTANFPLSNSAPEQPASQEVSKIKTFTQKLPPLIQAVIKTESNYNPQAVSNAGAKGLMQIMPDHYDRLGVTNPFDPIQNIKAGATILQEEIDRFQNLPLALAAYNSGAPTVLAAMKKANSKSFTQIAKYLPSETQSYVRKVLNNMSQVRSV